MSFAHCTRPGLGRKPKVPSPRPPEFPDGLTPNARLLIQALDRKSRGYPECWSSDRTLAACVRCCEKTVRNALAQLEACGLVERARDYSKGTRRRIRLLWKTPTSVPSLTVNISGQSGETFAGMDESPPHPLLEDQLREDDDDRPRDEPIPEPSVASSSSPTLAPAGEEQATTGEEQAVVAKASEAFPHVPGLDRKVRALADCRTADGSRAGLEWVDVALDWALARKAVSWGFMIATVKAWEREGCSGPPKRRGAPPVVYHKRVEPEPVDQAELRSVIESIYASRPELAALRRNETKKG